MNYKIIDLPHKCTLPNPEAFSYGTRIQCTEVIPKYAPEGSGPCGHIWWWSEKFFSKRAYWSDDWGW